MATLSVHELMGFKVDREAVATLVLPQLWAMSIGPLLNVEQFERFMQVIQKLGDRVRKEHNQFLRDSQRIEDRSTVPSHSAPLAHVDFQSLVVGANGSDVKPVAHILNGSTSWDDDVWGNVLGNDNLTSTSNTPASPHAQPFPSPPIFSTRDARLNSQNRSTSSTFGSTNPTLSSSLSHSSIPMSNKFSPILSPMIGRSSAPISAEAQKPNYQPLSPVGALPTATISWETRPSLAPSPATVLTPTMGSMLKPSRTEQSQSTANKTLHNWDDFDPLA
jgi:SCY1-like protein 2